MPSPLPFTVRPSSRPAGRLGRVACAVVLLALLLGASSLDGYDFTRNRGTGLPIKWPAGPLSLTIRADAVTPLPGDGSTRAASIATAAQAWNPPLGSVQFQPQIAGTGAATDRNGQSEVAFAPTMFGQAFDARTLAVTFLRSSGNDATERDVLFNSNLAWDSYRGPLITHSGVWDIQRVAVHELGHVLGLDHPDEATPPQTVSAIMNSIVSDLTLPMTDDVTGAQVLYGPPGIPGNNGFAQAVPLTLVNNAARETGYNTNATKEAGEPLHAGNAGGRSIWWRWTPPASGTANLNTQGSVFDTTLGVYRGASLAALTVVASSDDLQDGVIQYSVVSFPVVAGTTYFIAVDGFDGDSGQVVLNLAFTPSALAAPVIVTPPADQVVALGAAVTLTVTATGAPAPAYQWFRDGVALPGATGASLLLPGVQATDAGAYTVAVTNSAGTVTSSAAILTVVPSATHAVLRGGYRAPGVVTLRQTLVFPVPASGLAWQLLLPTGWSYVAGGGSEGDIRPTPGQTSVLEWSWTTTPASPVVFSCTLAVPGASSGGQALAAVMSYQGSGGRQSLLARPDPLTVVSVSHHDADTDRDFRFSLLELTRAIEIYNTRRGTIRTGCYRLEGLTEDGFDPEPARALAAAVVLPAYHAGDSNRDGRISLLELTRIIELYNTRSGTTRTGAYHVVRVGETASEDGFAAGP